MIDIRQPTNEVEFQEMMEIVDQTLRDGGVKIHARPMRGWFEISGSLGLELRLFPRGKEEPRVGVYTGDDLTLRIFQWFDQRYGEKLAVRAGPGRIAVLIRDDLWEMYLPKVWGSIEFFISKTEKSSKQEDDLKFRLVPRYNVLEAIEGFPPGLIEAVPHGELQQLLDRFVTSYRSMVVIDSIRAEPMIEEAMSDMDAAVHHLLCMPPHFGLSKWASLQATEKVLKSYLAKHEARIPRHHDLFGLYEQAKKHELALTMTREIIAPIQCSAGVRYGDEVVSMREALDAHKLSISVCGAIAEEIANLPSAEGEN